MLLHKIYIKAHYSFLHGEPLSWCNILLINSTCLLGNPIQDLQNLSNWSLLISCFDLTTLFKAAKTLVSTIITSCLDSTTDSSLVSQLPSLTPCSLFTQQLKQFFLKTSQKHVTPILKILLWFPISFRV